MYNEKNILAKPMHLTELVMGKMYKHKTCDKRPFPKRTMICTA